MIGYGDYQVDLMDHQQEINLEEYLDWELKMTTNDIFEVAKEQWQEELQDMERQERGRYLFPEKGETRLRLLVSPEINVITSFYAQVITTYFEKARTRYMIPVLAADDTGTYYYEVKYAVVAKTVLKEILSILAGGEYDLFHPETGHAVTINRTGEGLSTRYSVIPSKDPVPIDYDQIEFEGCLGDIADEFMAQVASDKAAKEAEEDDIPF